MLYLVVLLAGLASDTMQAQEGLYIDFRRSGGFAGIETKVKIHGDSLTSEDFSRLGTLIDQSGFFTYDKSGSISEHIPDQFEYNITIKYKGQQRTLHFLEGVIPDQFSGLFRYLTQKARSQ